MDLVSSQLRVAGGESLEDLGLSQDSIVLHGAALQCRITTEDPANGFRPDTGRITAYRSPAGPGYPSTAAPPRGAEVSAHFDSMLVKLTCRGRTSRPRCRAKRRGHRVPDPRRVDEHPVPASGSDDPDFRAGRITTSFIDERPQLLTARSSADRGTKILNYLADVTVNKPHGERPSSVYPQDKLPPIDLSVPPHRRGPSRNSRAGPEGFARLAAGFARPSVTDTTFRDAHQSLLATRIRTSGLLLVAPHIARMTPQLLSMECWGGATYDVALRFLKEDPWERLAALREAMPNICLQMLLRGRNTVGYTPYPENVTTCVRR